MSNEKKIFHRGLKILKRSDAAYGVLSDLTKLKKFSLIFSKTFLRKKIIKNYIETQEIKKLTLGAGRTVLKGWLNTDLSPKLTAIIHLDVTDPFPFKNNTFDYIYGEHLIEHLSWDNALFMLKECRRILKPLGTVRFSTPDLKVLIDLYKPDKLGFGEKYIKSVTDRFLTGIKTYNASFIINNAFRNWGHLFLYDEVLFNMVFKMAGFTDICRCLPWESKDPNLRGLEFQGKNSEELELATFETMIFEGKKPN